jgi:hypothetical protein
MRRSSELDPARTAGSTGAQAPWDAAEYDRVRGPQAAWAVPVLDRLGLRGDGARVLNEDLLEGEAPVLDDVRLNITATRGGA